MAGSGRPWSGRVRGRPVSVGHIGSRCWRLTPGNKAQCAELCLCVCVCMPGGGGGPIGLKAAVLGLLLSCDASLAARKTKIQ